MISNNVFDLTYVIISSSIKVFQGAHMKSPLVLYGKAIPKKFKNWGFQQNFIFQTCNQFDDNCNISK